MILQKFSLEQSCYSRNENPKKKKEIVNNQLYLLEAGIKINVPVSN